MGNLLNAEIFKAVKRPATWIMLAILAVLTLAFYAIIYFSVNDPATDESLRPDSIVDSGGFLIGANVASILVIVFAAQLVGSEYGWGTIRALASRASSRSAVIVSKIILLAGYALLTLIVTAGVAIVGALVFGGIAGNDTSLGSDTWIATLEAIGRYLLANGVYALLALMITVLTRSTAAGIAGGIALSLLEPIIFLILTGIADFFETVQEYFLAYNVQGLAAATTEGATDDFSITRGAVIVAAWLIAFLAITFIVFRRRDITSG